MGNGRGWVFYLFNVTLPIVGFLGVVVPGVWWLWKRFRKPPASFTLPPIPPGIDPQEFVAKLRGMADYVDGLLTTPEEQKRNIFKKARVEQEKQHHSAAIDLFRSCLSLELSAKEKAALHLQMGNSYSRLGEPGHALAAYQLALSEARQCEEIEAEGAALGNMGLVYADKGELDKALTHHQQSLDIYRKIGNPLGEANALCNIGSVYADKGELDKALTHYQQALDIDRKIGNPLGEAKALGNMGFALVQKRMLPKARDYLRASYKLYLKLGAPPGTLAKVKKALDELGEG
jgi:tetratricopeptide (TPR) repeat protein